MKLIAYATFTESGRKAIWIDESQPAWRLPIYSAPIRQDGEPIGLRQVDVAVARVAMRETLPVVLPDAMQWEFV